MRYAIFTDIHANLEALEAVLAKIDELAEEQPIDQIWFLGDLVGYGPNPNECIDKLLERTNVIIAGNHDWAAVGKIDLDDFSTAARISAEWTAEQLTEEHRVFLTNLPERIEIDECTLVHGSPYGPLWEYLTSEVLAERSFKYFNSRYCFVGHTHVPIIYQQLDDVSNAPTLPLSNAEQQEIVASAQEDARDNDEEETKKMAAVRPQAQAFGSTAQASSNGAVVETGNTAEATTRGQNASEGSEQADEEITPLQHATVPTDQDIEAAEAAMHDDKPVEIVVVQHSDQRTSVPEESIPITDEETINNAEERLNSEIDELLALLGLSQSMIQVTNEMIVPPEGNWQAPDDYRAIVNPGGVGQPRDGDPRAAFMIYDTKKGFTFYRVPYKIEKTQEKIIQAGLPHYLASRLAYGR